MIIVFFLSKNYSTENMSAIRESYSRSICYKTDLNFLRLKKNLTQSMSNRLAYRSQFYKSYKLLRFYYTNLLRSNFCKKTPNNLKIYKLKNFDNKQFFLAFNQYQALKNFDNVLLWRANQINALFNIKMQMQKKKKKYIFSQHIYFTKPNKRLLFVWKWLNVFVQSNVVKNIPRSFSFITGFENFICAPQESHTITQFKFQIYKLHAIRNL